MDKIGLVTVLYKSDNVLDGFVKSISIQTYRNYVLYIIDNSACDATDALLQRLTQTYPVSQCHHIKSPGNIGVAAGNNVGIKKAIDDNCTYVLLLNNDIVIERDDVLKKMMGLAERENIITPKILNYDTKKIWTAGGYMDKLRGLGVAYGMNKEDGRKYNVSKYVTSESTCFMLINVNVFASVGLMDENYFLYVDDTDFVFRATQRGYKVFYEPSIVILHKVSNSTGGNQTLFYVYYSNRNKIYFIRKNFKGVHRFISLSYVLLTRIYFYFNYNKQKKQMLVNAVKDGLRLKY